jgi:hypothetical protein
MDEYLNINEAAAFIRLKPKTLRNKMAAGVFRLGVHYFSPPGLGPRFKRSALVAWIEQSSQPAPENEADVIPMARGYSLGKSTLRKAV